MTPRRPARDPRTVARDIPGVLDGLFPQLAPGVVIHLNRDAYHVEGCSALPMELVAASSLQPAMLFEIAVAAGEQLVFGGQSIDMQRALELAIERQRRHFDAKLPEGLTDVDERVTTLVAENLAIMLRSICREIGAAELLRSPHIPGYQWIASGTGDFSQGSRLIEVKCTNRPFSSADYRQILMYWLLSYASSVEGGTIEWTNAVLLNPRLNVVVEVSFDEVIKITGAGRSKVDLLELFSSMVGDHNVRMLSQM